MMETDRLEVLLVANYAPDRQPSMQRFATLLQDGLAARGIAVRTIRPEPRLLGDSPIAPGAAKWIGYLDKFVMFVPALRRAARAAGARRLVVHVCDHSNAVYVPAIRHAPHVVTCHDLLAVRAARSEFPQARTGWPGRLLQRAILNGLRAAGSIVCDSQATRRDVLRIVGAGRARTGVVYPAVSPAFRSRAVTPASPAVRDWLARGEPFLLHVGGSQWYKNRAGLFEAYGALCERMRNAPALVVAGKRLRTEERARLPRGGAAGRLVELTDVTDEDLAALYTSAALLLFPSVAEGFGWPVLEAMACGCRVVVSDRAPLGEIAGRAGTTVDPDDPRGAADVVAAVLAEAPAARDAHRAAGFEQASRFSLGRMIDGYVDAYRTALG
jgi:glycosyltransferase involved in cell wall biosynthesis